jgi:hypothetical protein
MATLCPERQAAQCGGAQKKQAEDNTKGWGGVKRNFNGGALSV